MGVGKLHVNIVVGLQNVLRICFAPHPFANVKIRCGELKRPPTYYAREPGGEGGRVTYRLVIHIFVSRIGPIDVLLPGNRRKERDVPLFRMVVSLERRVQSSAEGVAVVHHRPGVCALERQADNAVLYLVPIDVGLNVH